MKDYHFPVAVTLPAAIGLVGVLWFLRRRSSSNGGEKRAQKVLPNDKELNLEWDSKEQIEQQEQHNTIEGITISQRKIPETLACNHDNCELKCKESVDVIDTVISQSKIIVSEDQDVKLESYSDVEREMGTIQDDQVASLNSSVVVPLNDQDKSCILADIPQKKFSKPFADVPLIGKGNSVTFTNISQIDQGNSPISSNVNECGQSVTADITIMQDSLTPLITKENGQGDSLTLSQRVYIDQQIITAMGDGMKEAHSKLFKPTSHSESLKEMPHNSLTPNCFPSDEQSVVCEVMEGVQIDKTPTPEFPIYKSDSVTPDHFPRDEQSVACEVMEGVQIDETPTPEFPTVVHTGDSLTPDHFPRNEQSVTCEVVEEVQIDKTSILECPTVVHTDHCHEVDLNMKISTSSDIQSEWTTDTTTKSQVKDHAVGNETPKVHSELISSAGSKSISDENISNKNENSAAQQKESTSSLQEVSESQLLPSSDSPLEADTQPHVNTYDHAVDNLSQTKILKESDQENQSHTVSNSISEPATGLTDAGTENTSFNAIENSGSNNVNALVINIKSLPREQDEIRSAARPWLLKASSSSIDSFGPEEIDAIWGIQSSMENLDAELCFADTDPVVLPSTANSLLNQKASPCDLDIKQDVISLSALLFEDRTNLTGSSSSKKVESCGNTVVPLPDKSLKDESLPKSDSPTCDNKSEGSNDSGRGGSEHDMVCQGGEALVHYDFNIPSELCGQFIGRHGKNINYLKSKTGALVSLTNNPFTSEYQVCQIVGTQADVDDTLNMIRRKFPLQDYPHLTMVPINMSGPLPLQSDNQLVFPETMQLSLPEGVSVEVFVSAVVDAGQVFVQQPTHCSFMSLEKMNYFLNLVYGQDPNVPCVPTPIESGIICVCESEGFWYRAMIMSAEDENGEVQVKFVDYGGYVNVPVFALKQIRADFMSLPFQAVECFMANITPNQNERFFSDEATQALSEMTQGKLLQCQVVARTEYGTPYIHLYQINSESNSAVLINRALVNSRLVRWIEIL